MPSTTIAQPGIRRKVPIDTRRLLLAGALAGPLFVGSTAVQMLTRDGFDITRHPISLLATGGLGWIQMATFGLAGIGAVALAIGVRREFTVGVGRRWLARLVGAFGAGVVVAGLFPMDPEYGFPVGTPDGPVDAMSWHSVVHGAAAAFAFTALAVACIVATVRSVRQHQYRNGVVHGVTAAVLLLPGPPEYVSIQVALSGVVAFAWTTALAVRLRRRSADSTTTR